MGQPSAESGWCRDRGWGCGHVENYCSFYSRPTSEKLGETNQARDGEYVGPDYLRITRADSECSVQ
jgi:hypothetical protein